MRNRVVGWLVTAGYAGWIGARTGAVLALLYGLAVGLLFVARTSMTIVSKGAPGPGSLAPTLAASAVSILIVALVGSAILGIMAALLGAATAIVVRWFLGWLNPADYSLPAVVLGLVVGLGWVFAAHVVGLRADLPLVWPSSATYLFWVGLPSLLYLGASARGTLQIARGLREGYLKAATVPGSSVPASQTSG
jgi:hypothetical protein